MALIVRPNDRLVDVTYLNFCGISAEETPFVIIASMIRLRMVLQQLLGSDFVYAAFELAVMKLHHLQDPAG